MWVKLHDGFPEDERVLGLSDKAFRLHVEGLCACARNLTDGTLSVARLRQLRATKAAIFELEACGLWRASEDGAYAINKFLDYNPSAEKVKHDRERAAKRQKSWRESNRSNGVTNGVSSPSPSRPQEVSSSTSDVDHEPPFAEELGISKLLSVVGDVDEEALAKIRGFARRLPEGSLAKVAESVRIASPRNRVGYALRALGSELKERT